MTAVADGVGFRSTRGPVLIALMVTTGLVAIDSTILATAVPSVVADLGGFSQFPWLFSIYLLAQAVTVPIYAKLADTVGRKPIILLGVALFLVASVLCGFAWSMPALIAFRALQGIAAGAIQPMAVTIAGDIYTVAERARVQGYIASVWAISSVVGPTLGGLFSEFVSWRWIFFVNVPLCLLALWLLVRRFDERIDRRRHSIDVTGAALLAVGVSALILGLLEGDQAWDWVSVPSAIAFGTAVVALIAFVVVERRAREPVLPLGILSRRLIATTTVISLGVGAMLLGLTSYVPTYLEGSLGVSPLLSGLALAALTIGWPVSASVSGRIYLRLGFRPTVLIGVAIAVVGTVFLALIAPYPSLLLVAVACFVTGLGFGLTATPALIAAQSSVEWEERGVVTGANLFARSVGSAVGVAVFGALANAVFSASDAGEGDPAVVTSASTVVFVAVAACSAITIAATLLMPPVRARPS